MKSLDGYLAAFEKKLDRNAKHLSCLLCIRSASLLDSKHFVSARCASEYKTNVVYQVAVVLGEQNTVLETQCE